MSLVTTVAGLVTKPITQVVSKYIDRKTNLDSIKGKAAQAKQGDSTKVTLTDAEWETLSKNQESGTWKDEFVTVTFMLPLWLIFGGTLYQSFTADPRILEGTLAGIVALRELGLDFGEITFMVVLAAIGLKLWRAN